jgi:hypothetical protein
MGASGTQEGGPSSWRSGRATSGHWVKATTADLGPSDQPRLGGTAGVPRAASRILGGNPLSRRGGQNTSRHVTGPSGRQLARKLL